MDALPFEVREAVIQVSGKAFNYKGPLRDLLRSAGVSNEILAHHQEEPKFRLTRSVLNDLDSMGDAGLAVQWRIARMMARLRSLPDPSVTNSDAALGALRDLKEKVVQAGLPSEEERDQSKKQREEATRAQQVRLLHEQKLGELHNQFVTMAVSPDDPQGRGYGLEDLLRDLFAHSSIPYRPPYRTGSQQIDGSFQYNGNDYLVEARWRKGFPSTADLATFKYKIDSKLAGTRGLFVSIIGFRPEVVAEFPKGTSSNMILMCGQDLTLVLEGRISLRDALDHKLNRAAQEGVTYFPLIHIFN